MPEVHYDMRGPFDPKEARAWVIFFGKILVVAVLVTVFVMDRINIREGIGESKRVSQLEINGMRGTQQEYFGRLIQNFTGQIVDMKSEIAYLRSHVEENGIKIARIEGRLDSLASAPASLEIAKLALEYGGEK